MRILVIALLLGVHALAQTAPAPAAATSTALGALKLVPADQAANLVAIFAREGIPAPDRWYIVTFDPSTESGVHESVVVGGKLVASRQLSQFADSLKAADVLGAGGVQVDSDQAGQVAQDYARANNVVIDKVNYELKRQGMEPFWKLICLNQSGNRLGELTIAADKGTVISHGGFAVEPPPVRAAQAVAHDVAMTDAQALAATGTTPLTTGTATATPKPSPKPTPKKREEAPKGLGGKLKHYFFGH